MLTFLLAFADEKDLSKVENLYIKYKKIMYAAAYSKLSGRATAQADAEDAVQNAFLKIIRHINSIRFDESEERIRAYCVSIAINEAINILNKNTELVGLDDINSSLVSDEDFVERLCLFSEYENVKKAIIKLDDKYRIVLLMKYAEDLTVKEISDILNMKEATVYSNIRRGKQMLINMLEKEGII